MARTFNITDGTTTVNLLDADGFQATSLGAKTLSVDANVPAGHLHYVETYQMLLYSTDQDDAADQLQTLFALLRKAHLYHTTSWQNVPVYLTAQTDRETNARYAMVFGVPSIGMGDVFDIPFASGDLLENLSITLLRGVWRSGAPGATPSAKTLSKTDASADTTKAVVANQYGTAGFAFLSRSGSPATDTLYGTDTPGLAAWYVDTDSAASTDAQGKLLVWTSTDPVTTAVVDLATAGAFVAGSWTPQHFDGAAWSNTGSSNFTWYAENANSTDTFDNVFLQTTDLLVMSWLVPNESTDVGTFDYGDGTGAVYNVGLLSSTDTFVTTQPVQSSDEIYLQNKPYIELSSDILKGDIPPMVEMRMFGMYGQTDSDATFGATSKIIMGAKTHKSEDYSGVNLLSNPGFETAGAGGADIWANWSEQAGSGTLANETAAQYEGDDAMKATTAAGSCYVYQNITVVAGKKYRLRFWTRGDASVAGRYQIYDVSNNADISALGTTGVAGATYTAVVKEFTAPSGCTSVRIYLYSPSVAGDAYFDACEVTEAFGFASHLNCGGGGLPSTDWAVSYDTDTTGNAESTNADTRSPGGFYAACTFAATTLKTRVSFAGDDLLDSYRGEYKAFLRAEQVGGTDGDVSVVLQTRLGSTNVESPARLGAVVDLTTHDKGWEIIDLGKFSIPFVETADTDDLDGDIIFEIQAVQNVAGATIKFADLILMPVDEWSIVLDDPVSDNNTGSSTLRGNRRLDLDSGVLAHRAALNLKSGTSYLSGENWFYGGKPFGVEPGRLTRIYFLMGHYHSDFGWGTGTIMSTIAQSLVVELRAQALYLSMRGAD